jgi:tetratricopeptide (TPR) repeat protein
LLKQTNSLDFAFHSLSFSAKFPLKLSFCDFIYKFPPNYFKVKHVHYYCFQKVNKSLKMKCDKIAEMLRKEGNAKYLQREHQEALILYNESLCFSPPNSSNFALVFANRSAVYLELQQSCKCLENIKLARDHDYPKVDRLKQREEKCGKLQEIREEDSKASEFFKLSHPANEMIPFIVNCLELREDDKFGRFIITNEDLRVGDVISIEYPCFKSIDSSARFSRCAFCLKSNKLSLIPCNRGCSCSKFREVFSEFLLIFVNSQRCSATKSA